MKEALAVLCTPDMHRPMAQEAIEHLKTTNLERVELLVLDNAYDQGFRHPLAMEEMLAYAHGRPVVFADDDVLVTDVDWFGKLVQAATDMNATIAGCVHMFPSGEINHTGIVVHADGTSEMLRSFPNPTPRMAYCPAVSSALVLIRDSNAVHFDTRFEKYQHDIDICLSAWQAGLRVVCSADLKVVHVQGEYMAGRPDFRDVLAHDVERFQLKWQAFAATAMCDITELTAYRELARGENWENTYNRASRTKSSDERAAAHQYRRVIDECPWPWLRAGAYFHLYHLERKPDYLRSCVELNPHHQKASRLLRELTS